VTTVHSLVDDEVNDQDRRLSVFSGDLFVYAPGPASLALRAAVGRIAEQTLGADPARAQGYLSEAEFLVLYRAALRAIRHAVFDLAAALVVELGCDPATTYVAPPSMSVVPGGGFLAGGVGLPLHPHRDTWYAAPPAQVNWWVPLYDLDDGACAAFHPRYFDVALTNSSEAFDYEEWRGARRAGRAHRLAYSLTLPRVLEPIDLTPEVRIGCPAGGVVMSSAAQLRSAVPNETLRTRCCAMFQTVSEADLEDGAGAVNLDAEPQGSALARFVRCSDGSPIPSQLVKRELVSRRRS
jgi:hypothetical protein